MVKELNLEQYTKGSPQDKEAFSRDLFQSLKDIGFVILTNHSIPNDLLEKAYLLSKNFFDLPQDIKKSYASNNSGQRGYTPFGVEVAKGNSVSDLKEFWHVGRHFENDSNRPEGFPQNVWPEELENFRETFLQLYKKLDLISFQALEAITGHLDVKKDYFSHVVNKGNTILRLLHYPPLKNTDNPKAIRAAAHEDINLITLLISASQAGLEVLDRKGNWVPIHTSPKNIILDTGDMMQRLTNNVLPSTTHRVVNPSNENVSRFSMPFFVHPNQDFLIKCLDSCRQDGEKYEPISAEDFLQERLREIGLKK